MISEKIGVGELSDELLSGIWSVYYIDSVYDLNKDFLKVDIRR